LMLTPWSKGVETGRLDVEDEFDGAPTLTI